MATGVTSWSQTASSNASSDSAVNWAEGQAPSSVNDSGRGMMSSVAKYRDDNAGSLTTGGTSTAYTLTTNQVFASLSAMSGQVVFFQAHTASGASPTLNVDSLGAKALKSVSGTALATGYLLAGGIYAATYSNSGSEWVVHGLPGALGTLASATITALSIGSSIAPSSSDGAALGSSSLMFSDLFLASGAVINFNNGDVTATHSANTLAFAGASSGYTFDALVTVTGALAASGNFAIATSKFTVEASSGDAVVAGTLAVTGVVTGRIGLLHVREEQTSGTHGGTFTSGAWRTRVLNTVKTNEITGASLASNQITLPAGTYEIVASAPAEVANGHTAKLANITDGTDTLIGTAEYTDGTGGSTKITRSFVNGRFTLAAQKVLELQHQTAVTKATTGLGRACNFSVVEVYAEVMIRKVA